LSAGIDFALFYLPVVCDPYVQVVYCNGVNNLGLLFLKNDHDPHLIIESFWDFERDSNLKLDPHSHIVAPSLRSCDQVYSHEELSIGNLSTACYHAEFSRSQRVDLYRHYYLFGSVFHRCVFTMLCPVEVGQGLWVG
jgi:hypothetical protein